MITQDKVVKVLAKLTGPMTLGIFGMIIFNLVDTYYVGQLGTVELAALSFTFPIVLIISSIAHGLGVGMTVAVSRAAGQQNREKQIDLITWGMGLSFLVVAFFVIVGQLTITPVFTLLGADTETLEVIRKYMKIWYWGVIFVVSPMIGNSAIRGMGDTKTPSQVMLIAAILNMILDPLLIFGIGPFPELGVSGAALATVMSRGVLFCVAWYILIFREKVISLKNHKIVDILNTWKELLYVGIPNILSKMIIPISSGIITGLIAVYGREAVAGFGIATRIDMFALLLVNALISILPVFVGQNWGAGLQNRVIRGLKISNMFSLYYGVLIYILFLIAGKFLVRLINDDPKVIAVAIRYMRIVPLAYGLQGMMQISITTLNVLKKPILSTLLTFLQIFGLYIPLAMVGSRYYDITGIFSALAISYFIMGPLSQIVNLHNIQKAVSKTIGKTTDKFV